MAQLDLFGSLVQFPPLSEPDPRWVALSQTIPAHVRLGGSTWTFRGWSGLVYRRSYRSDAEFVRDSLYEYARFPVFGCVGIDRSFYKPLTATELSTYAQLLPVGFPCVSKVWRDLATFVYPKHSALGTRAGKPNPNFLNAEMFRTTMSAYSAFSSHVGPLVIEVPPFTGTIDVPRFERAVETFLQLAPAEFSYAFELREPAFLTERYFALLREHHASHCFNQWAWMPSIAEQFKRARGTSGMGKNIVARLMLPPAGDYETLKSAYLPFDRLIAPQPAMRKHVIELADAVATAEQQLFVLINNKAEGSAPWTAIALAEMFATR